ncbi:MAG: protein-L-isoaspartate O-methyltransferase [Acidiferrobacterales bacterium]
MGEIDFAVARHNMVEQQVRPWEVLDQRVLGLIHGSPREDYVPEQYRNLAYADLSIPLGHGQIMMAPRLEARLLQELAIRPTDRILEIGTGSGYMTSLLAALGEHVYSVEIIPELESRARGKLAAHNVKNVTIESGDGASGWDQHAPYDAILITGSLPLLPDSFRSSLALGGRLAAIVGTAPVMEAKLIQRLGSESWTQASLFETDLPPLINAKQPERFVF